MELVKVVRMGPAHVYCSIPMGTMKGLYCLVEEPLCDGQMHWSVCWKREPLIWLLRSALESWSVHTRLVWEKRAMQLHDTLSPMSQCPHSSLVMRLPNCFSSCMSSLFSCLFLYVFLPQMHHLSELLVCRHLKTSPLPKLQTLVQYSVLLCWTEVPFVAQCTKPHYLGPCLSCLIHCDIDMFYTPSTFFFPMPRCLTCSSKSNESRNLIIKLRRNSMHGIIILYHINGISLRT